MKVTGFSFIKNAVKYDYPVVESIKSILPVCDDFVIAVGNSDDNTLELIENIDSQKIKIIPTFWDENLRQGGRVLSDETNKAIKEISNDTDWAFYIQADEVVHEKYLDVIYSNMQKNKDINKIDGLLFKYLHFYGSYDYIATSSKWYRREIRVVKNKKYIHSFGDAQGFKKDNNGKLNVKLIDAYIYHYGWVKDPKAMQDKQMTFNKLWHPDDWIEQNISKKDKFDYSGIDSLRKFTEAHPTVMLPRIDRMNWEFDYDLTYNTSSFREKLRNKIEKLTGWRIGEYKNYKLIP